jgi:hypothetical protein
MLYYIVEKGEMRMIKAIETEYNGYKFRSRVEARWAVFFDTLGIRYMYEEDGYDIDGTWYLPDFHLPEQECWFEAKGEGKAIVENHALYQGFASQVGPLVAFATPNAHMSGIKHTVCDHNTNAGYCTDSVAWYFCSVSGFQLSLRCSHRCTVWTEGNSAPVRICRACDVGRNTLHNFTHPAILEAYKAARQSRFEHR